MSASLGVRQSVPQFLDSSGSIGFRSSWKVPASDSTMSRGSLYRRLSFNGRIERSGRRREVSSSARFVACVVPESCRWHQDDRIRLSCRTFPDCSVGVSTSFQQPSTCHVGLQTRRVGLSHPSGANRALESSGCRRSCGKWTNATQPERLETILAQHSIATTLIQCIAASALSPYSRPRAPPSSATSFEACAFRHEILSRKHFALDTIQADLWRRVWIASRRPSRAHACDVARDRWPAEPSAIIRSAIVAVRAR